MPDYLKVIAHEGAEVREIRQSARGPFLGDRVSDSPQGSLLRYEDGPTAMFESAQGMNRPQTYRVISRPNNQVGAVIAAAVQPMTTCWLRDNGTAPIAHDVEIAISDQDIEQFYQTGIGDEITVPATALANRAPLQDGVLIRQAYDHLEIRGSEYTVVRVTPTPPPVAGTTLYPNPCAIEMIVERSEA